MASRRPLSDVTVFAHLPDSQDLAHRFVPAGRLARAQGAAGVPYAMNFAYGTRYLDRSDAFEVEPRGLGLRDRQVVRGVALFPLPGLNEFGGIRDAASDAWGRRVIEARMQAPANSLDEFTYLLEAGSDRVGALDVRERTDSAPINSAGGLTSLPYLLQWPTQAKPQIISKPLKYTNGTPFNDALLFGASERQDMLKKHSR